MSIILAATYLETYLNPALSTTSSTGSHHTSSIPAGGASSLLSCVGVLLRLNFWFFSGNCRPCLRVVQLPEWTTGPTSQETPTTLPAGNEGSQAYSVLPCLQPGYTDHLGRS